MAVVKFLLPILSAPLFVACAKQQPEVPKTESRWIVIYRDRIAPENEVVWLTRTDSKSESSLAFEYLVNHCEDLRKLWEKTEGSHYFCSTTVFPGRAPRMMLTD